MEAALVILALVVVMLVVPWILAPASPDRGAREPGCSSAGTSSASLFTSHRERRLWLWTLAVLVAIYATLWPAQALAAALRERTLLRLSSALVLVVVGVAIGARWVKMRPGRREIGVALGVSAAYLTAAIRMASVEERTHLFEYGLVAILAYHALAERHRNGRRVPSPAALAAAGTAALGWLDEGIQSLMPGRVYDLRDVGFNALAGLMAIASSLALRRARRRDAAGEESP